MIKISKADVLWNYIAQFFSLASGLFTLPLILKMLTVEEIALNYIFLTISSLVMLFDFGFSPQFSRNVSYVYGGAKTLKKEGIEAEIKIFNGLLVDFMYKENVNILIRGLRALSDYEYELQFTLTNKTLAKSEFETVFLTASREYLYLSSSLVKEVALNKGDLSFFVTENVERRLIDKVKK